MWGSSYSHSRVLENDSNLSQARTMLSEIGYTTFVLLMNSVDYGVPQDRVRIYIGCVALEQYCYDIPSSIASTVEMAKCIQSMQISQPVDYEDLLLKDDDELVTLELQYWQGLRASSHDVFRKDNLWQKKHQEEFEKHGLRWGHVEASPAMKESPWYQALSPREQDLVVFTLHAHPQAVSIDVSQSVGRHRPTTHKVAGTVTPGEKRYMMDRNRLRVAVESLALQAIPWQELDLSADPPVLQSLAGNAWTGTVAMASFFGIIAHLPMSSASSGGLPGQEVAAVAGCCEGGAVRGDLASPG